VCTCTMKEKISQNGSPRIFDYVFECTHADHRHVETIAGQSNDSTAKSLAVLRCQERHGDS
jgi:hypothetical protein